MVVLEPWKNTRGRGTPMGGRWMDTLRYATHPSGRGAQGANVHTT